MKRVLITGATGAIGIHMLGHVMHNTDWEAVLIDSFNADHKGYFDRLGITLEDHPYWRSRIRLFTHDLAAPFTPREVERIGKIDYIINLASRSDVQNSIEDALPFVRNNVDLMLHMLEYARLAKPEVFIHFSTDEVYGPAPKDSTGHREWDPIVPSNPYSASKAAQEALAVAWWRSFNVPIIITNTMNNFGEMQAPSKFPAMIQQKIERGETISVHATEDGEIGTRYYLHSRNAADAVLFILQNVTVQLHRPGEIDRPLRYNIVGDKQVSNLDLVETIGRLMGKEAKYEMVSFHDKNPGHDLHYGLDGSLLAEAGWRSPMSFEESLKNTIEWQREHPEWMR
jgi:dTDP-glucose 4,6-dehydratase